MEAVFFAPKPYRYSLLLLAPPWKKWQNYTLDHWATRNNRNPYRYSTCWHQRCLDSNLIFHGFGYPGSFRMQWKDAASLQKGWSHVALWFWLNQLRSHQAWGSEKSGAPPKRNVIFHVILVYGFWRQTKRWELKKSRLELDKSPIYRKQNERSKLEKRPIYRKQNERSKINEGLI